MALNRLLILVILLFVGIDHSAGQLYPPEQIERWTKPEHGIWAAARVPVYKSSDYLIQTQRIVPAYPIKNGIEDRTKPPKWFARITYCLAGDSSYKAYVYCLPGTNKKPNPALQPIWTTGELGYVDNAVVVGDAFDNGNLRNLTSLYSNPLFSKLVSLDYTGNSPRHYGYDLFFIDFTQGAGNLLINAGIEMKFLEWLQAVAPNQIIVAGPSMSGVLGRIALLYSMPKNNSAGLDLARKVKGFLSMDSPHQGASISPHLQDFLAEYSGKGRAFPGLNGVTAMQWDALNECAAHQLLYEHIYQSTSVPWCQNCDRWGSSAVHDNLFGKGGYLESHGEYRTNMKMASIACSNFYVPHSGDPSFNRYADQRRAFVEGVRGIKDTLYGLGAGGPMGTSTLHELAPGSTGQWYYNLSSANSKVPSMTTHVFGGENFKGTFMPIYSVFDIDPAFNCFSLSVSNPPVETILFYTPFDAIYWLTNQANGYVDGQPTSTSRNSWRYEHIVFDDQMMGRIVEALMYIGNPVTNLRSRVRSFDGDRKTDLLFFEPGNNTLHVSISTGDGFKGPGSGFWIGTVAAKENFLIGNFDGDALNDIAYIEGDNSIHVRLSDGKRFRDYAAAGIGSQWIRPNTFGGTYGRYYVGDFNGDRMDDLLFFEPGNNSVHVSISKGTRFGGTGSGQWIASNGFGNLKDNFLTGDFNGDGKTDLAYLDLGRNLSVRLSTGTAFTQSGANGLLISYPTANGRCYAGDYNGDGKDDILFFDATDNSITVNISSGSDFNGAGTGKWVPSNGFGNKKNNYLPGDFNGDGKTDLAYAEEDGSIHVRISTGIGFVVEGLGSAWIHPGEFGGTHGKYHTSTTYRGESHVVRAGPEVTIPILD